MKNTWKTIRAAAIVMFLFGTTGCAATMQDHTYCRLVPDIAPQASQSVGVSRSTDDDRFRFWSNFWERVYFLQSGSEALSIFRLVNSSEIIA